MLVTRFWRSTSGNFAMMFAVSLPLVLTGVGFALDVSNMMTAKSNLQNALDSAVLAASRLADKSTSRDDLFNGYFKANTSEQGNLVNPTAHLTVEQGVNYIKTTATASADVALNFGFVFGKNGHLSVKASAFESTAKLEVALALDNTGSMGDANMKALRDAANDLITTLQDEKKNKPERKIRAALVPFVTAVNIKSAGENYLTWIDQRTSVLDTDPSLNGKNFETFVSNKITYRYGHWDLFSKLRTALKKGSPVVSDLQWKGCVEARPATFNSDGTPKLGSTLNLDDTPPDPKKPETMFVPYFAPDEPGKKATAANSDSAYNNTYLDDLGIPKNADAKATQLSVAKYSTEGIANIISEGGKLTNGPNYACATPIAPLTEDLAALKTEIDKMTYWNGSGTNVSEGLAWGYRVLSPGEPYTQGESFDEKDTTKVIVVFTDGENNVFGASGAAINKSDYGSYGYLDTSRLGTNNRSTALDRVNKLTQGACTMLKNKQVRVFTVVLGADTQKNRDLYSTCATSAADYFPTKNADQLKAAFKQISYAITELYVTN